MSTLLGLAQADFDAIRAVVTVGQLVGQAKFFSSGK